jgi:microcystin-dependent protein
MIPSSGARAARDVLLIHVCSRAVPRASMGGAMQDPYLGEIMTFAGPYVPDADAGTFASCNGQLINVNNNQALFAVLGTTWGGDGRSTFGLPDLRGHSILGSGTGAGLTPRIVGQSGGSESATLTLTQLPVHSHIVPSQTATATTMISKGSIPISATSVVNCDSAGASTGDPSGGYPGTDPNTAIWSGSAGATMNAAMVQTSAQVTSDVSASSSLTIPQQPTVNAGSGQPLSIMQPWACMTYAIALNGLFPPH